MPFFGILEDRHLSRVPGTVLLDEEEASSIESTVALKHGKGKNSHIVLVPQPSDDPNDPLNWSQAKKNACYAICSVGALLYAGTIGPLTNAGLVVIAVDFKTTIGSIVFDNGYQVLVVACCGPIISALARKFGKRPCFLFSGLACLVGSIVGSTATNEKAYLAARIIQGFAVTSYESLIFTIVGDLFFVHERGVYIAIASFLLAGVANLCSIVTGPIVANLGWKYLFHFFILFGSLQLICQYLFVPETAYNRDHRMDIDEVTTPGNLEVVAELEKETAIKVEDLGLSQTRSIPPPKTWWQEKAIFTGKYSNDSMLQLLIAPFAVNLNLTALWVTLMGSFYIGQYCVIAFTLAQIYSYPPYLLTPSGIGLMSLGPLVGAVLGSLSLGLISDPIIRWASRRNKGVFEPEYRLLPIFPVLVVGPALIGLGYLAQSGGSVIGASALYGVLMFGCMYLLTLSSSYALDAYRGMSNEIFISSMASKNLLLFPYSYFINSYMAKAGPQKVYGLFGSIGLAMTVTIPVLYVFGKRYRSYWARHDLLEKLHIKTHAEI